MEDATLQSISAGMDALIQHLGNRYGGACDDEEQLTYLRVRVKPPRCAGVVTPKAPRHIREMLALFSNKERNLECGRGVFGSTKDSVRSRGIGKYNKVTLRMRL